MAAAAVSSHQSDEIPSVNSYGSLPRTDDIEVLPSTTIVTPSNLYPAESDSAIVSRHRPPRKSCLKPHQSETVFAICLFSLGLGLLLYVIISYWFTHSQISPIIIFICGLLCFIPGCYYLIEHYCFFLQCQRNRHRRLPIIDQDDIV